MELDVIREPIVFDKKLDCDLDKPYGYVYMITCKPNGKRYIGQHAFPHRYIDPSYLGSGKLMRRAVKKYGIKEFDVQVLKWCKDLNSLVKSELEYILAFNAVESDRFYNIAYESHGFIAGELHPYYGKRGKDAVAYGNKYFEGKHHSEHAKELMRASSKRPEIREKNLRNLQKAIEHNTGRPLTPQHSHNISVALKKSMPKGKDNAHYGKYGKDAVRSKRVAQIDDNGVVIREYDCIRDVDKYGFNHQCVGDCCKGKQKTHRGYKWKYL